MEHVSQYYDGVMQPILRGANVLYNRKARRHETSVAMHTLEDFQRCPIGTRRLVVIGCTGSGKSTLLNVLNGNHFLQSADDKTKSDYTWRWDGDPVFHASHGCRAVTRVTSYANLSFMGNPERRFVAVDTPGHDDTEGDSLESKASRDTLREQAADLHNKLKALDEVHTILVLHDQVSSNRLNPATYAILQMIDEKFGDGVWDNVVVAYSQCNSHAAAGWRTDIDAKRTALQKEIRRKIPGCEVDVPVITLGGGYPEGDYVARAEGGGDFEALWGIMSRAHPLSTAGLKPFEGAHWRQFELVVKRRDDAVARADAALGYAVVLVKFAILAMLLFWRSALLPTWLSVIFLNVPSTLLDEVLLVGGMVTLVGPSKCWYSAILCYEQHLATRLEGWGFPACGNGGTRDETFEAHADG